MNKRVTALSLAALLFMASCKPGGSPEATPTVPPAPPTSPVVTPAPTPVADPTPNLYEGYDLISRIDGSTATIPLNEAGLDAYLGSHEGLLHNTTSQAYWRLTAGECDIVFCTYPSQDEFDYAKEKGVELEIVPVVKDALVFLNNEKNPVENLTRQQVVDVYTGKIKNWKELGGADSGVTPYQRNQYSGSQTLFEKLVMGDVTPMTPPSTLVFAEMGGLVDAVAVYDNAETALGYSMFYYVSDMYTYPNIRLLSVDGVKPTRESIAADQYAYVTNYYAVMRRDTPEGHPAREYLRWMLTEQGQRTAHGAGYVTLKPLDLPVTPGMFPGATRENSTQSSGTGGTKSRIGEPTKGEGIIYDDDYRFSAEFDGDAELERLVDEWLDSVYAKSPDNSHGGTWYLSDGLLLVWVSVFTGTYREAYSAVFDVKAKKRLKLSDLFYDGVNYIEYINVNLVDSTRRNATWFFGWDDFETRALKRPFTGYPNDFDNFFVDRMGEGYYLCLEPLPDDPFFAPLSTMIGHFWLKVPLTEELSPWGASATVTEYYPLDVKDNVVLAVPEIKGGGNYEAVNAKIKATAEKAAKHEGYLSVETDPNPDWKRIINPTVKRWGGNISVIYTYVNYSGSGDVSLGVFERLDVNLATGADVDPYAAIPEKWWEADRLDIYEWQGNNFERIGDYIPPGGSAYSNIEIADWDSRVINFKLTQPDGRELQVMLVVELSEIN